MCPKLLLGRRAGQGPAAGGTGAERRRGEGEKAADAGSRAPAGGARRGHQAPTRPGVGGWGWGAGRFVSAAGRRETMSRIPEPVNLALSSAHPLCAARCRSAPGGQWQLRGRGSLQRVPLGATGAGWGGVGWGVPDGSEGGGGRRGRTSQPEHQQHSMTRQPSSGTQPPARCKGRWEIPGCPGGTETFVERVRDTAGGRSGPSRPAAGVRPRFSPRWEQLPPGRPLPLCLGRGV